MKYSNYQDKVNSLEKTQSFDEDINAGEQKYSEEMKPNEKYEYNRFIDKVYYAFFRCIVFLFAPMINFFVYRLRIRRRKNLKNIKGGIIVSNHITLLEPLIIKQTVFRRIYFVSAPFNNKKGFAGYTLKILGNLPMSSKFSNQKALDGIIAKYLKQGKLIHFDPEQALWRGYKKIRPFKSGAFHYAVKNNVPVIPIIQLIREANFWDKLLGRKFKIMVKVLEPIYPNPNLNFKDEIENLKNRTREAIIIEANNHYKNHSDALKK